MISIPGNNLSNKHYLPVLIITILFIALGKLFPELVRQLELPILIILVLVLGIPHGATDHIISKEIMGKRYSFTSFNLRYLSIAIAYAILWYFLPLVSLALFILIAAFHFGQSQLLFVKRSHKSFIKNVSFILWGTYLLSSILLLNWLGTWEIIDELFYFHISSALIDQIKWPLIALLFAANILTLSFFFTRNEITKKEYLSELINLAVWPLLAHFTPLLLAFALYFGLWHSVISIKIEQKGFSTGGNTQLTFKRFLLYALPLSLATFVIYFVLTWANSNFFIYQSLYLLFFILIAVLTLPHIFVMQSFYLKKLPIKNRQLKFSRW